MERFNHMRTIFLLIGLLSLSQLQAQHPFLGKFTASVVTDGVFLQWTVNQGSTCLGVIIERRDDNGEFQEVGRIDEVCGSIDEPVDYDFLDEDPLVGVENSYQLILGLDGTSGPVSVTYFKVGDSGFSITINQQAAMLSVFSLRTLSNKHSIMIYDVSGKEVDRISFEGNATQIDVSDLNAGLFFIAIAELENIVHVSRIVKSI